MAHDVPPALRIFAAARPCLGEEVNGDAWTVQERGDIFRVSLIDGLGHGTAAAEAAQTAVQTLERAAELPAISALERCHSELYHTRGAAMSVADIDTQQRTLTFVGIGNVEGILRTPQREQRLVPQRGIAGANAPKPRVECFDLTADWLILLHSDGISSRVRIDDLDSTCSDDVLQAQANSLVEQWGRDHDDVTVVLICPPRESAP